MVEHHILLLLVVVDTLVFKMLSKEELDLTQHFLPLLLKVVEEVLVVLLLLLEDNLVDLVVVQKVK